MQQPKIYAILTHNDSNTQNLICNLVDHVLVAQLADLQHLNGVLFSRSEIDRFMDEEERHDIKILTKGNKQPLKTMSSGEQKKALLNHLLHLNPDFIVLVNPYDNLDVDTQSDLKQRLQEIATHKTLVQIVSRTGDILPTTSHFFEMEGDTLIGFDSPEDFWHAHKINTYAFEGKIPPPLEPIEMKNQELVSFNNVSVSFNGRQVLEKINWTIQPGEFWQLIGPNGSGKSTLLQMITGDSHKGYGQDLTLFGHKKGSGESVWDLKENIGYYAPAITDRFRGYHTLEHMVISGLHDSIGLYVQPTDAELNLAGQWLQLLGLQQHKTSYFRDLSTGEKRLVMLARAMVKHPPLLILDEPTAGLDDASAAFFVAMVNKIAKESDTAIVFVSHRKEPQLAPQYIYRLDPTPNGSIGKKEIL